MSTYKQYKNSINGISDVGETVKIIEKISATATRSLENKVVQAKSYTENITRLLARLIIFYKNNNHPLLRFPKNEKKALILVTGEKGLVGGLWQEIIEKFSKNRASYNTIIVIGQKGKNKLNKLNIPIDTFFSNPVKEQWSLPAQLRTEKIIRDIFAQLNQENFNTIDIIYPQFYSLADQRPKLTSFIPFKFDLLTSTESVGLPVFEQSKKKIFDRLLRKYIHALFFQIILETKLSELSSRTISMEHAANTTDKLIKKITFKYRKNRRLTVTQRQLENFTAHKILNLSL